MDSRSRRRHRAPMSSTASRSRSPAGRSAYDVSEQFGTQMEVFLRVSRAERPGRCSESGTHRRPRRHLDSLREPSRRVRDLQEGLRRSAHAGPEHEAVGPSRVVPDPARTRRVAAGNSAALRGHDRCRHRDLRQGAAIAHTVATDPARHIRLCRSEAGDRRTSAGAEGFPARRSRRRGRTRSRSRRGRRARP